MPIVHVSMCTGKTDGYRQAIFDGLYQALREALDVPEDDQFMTITEHDPSNFRYGGAFDITRSDDLIYIQITMFNTRPIEQKKALFERIAAHLTASPGIRPEDLFVNIYDTLKENWSVGKGLMQFGPGTMSHG